MQNFTYFFDVLLQQRLELHVQVWKVYLQLENLDADRTTVCFEPW